MSHLTKQLLKQLFSPPRTEQQRLVLRWSLRITLISVLLVLLCTLYPFNFSFGGGNLLKQVVYGFSNRTSRFDLIANVIFFMPFGFGLAGLFDHARCSSLVKLAIALIASTSLSTSVEMLQVFLPTRAPTYTDVITNTMGGVIGWLCFQLGGVWLLSTAARLTNRLKAWMARLSFQQLTAAFLIYLLLSFSVAIALQSGTLSSWDASYPLKLGNDRASGRAWEGSISEVIIADRIVSQPEAQQLLTGQIEGVFRPQEIVASYSLQGRAPYPDQQGQATDLVWRGQTTGDEVASSSGAVVNSSRWLETEGALTAPIERLQTSSAFTVSLRVTPATTDVGYFAQFLTIGAEPNHHNFAMGQIGPLVLFWLKNSETKANPMPDGFLGGIFTAGEPRRLVFTYAGSFARLYTDAAPIVHQFDLTSVNHKIFSLGLIFAPLGILLTFVINRFKGRLFFYVILISSGVLLPPALLEGLLVLQSGRSISRSNLLLGLLILLSTLLIFRDRFSEKNRSTKGHSPGN